MAHALRRTGSHLQISASVVSYVSSRDDLAKILRQNEEPNERPVELKFRLLGTAAAVVEQALERIIEEAELEGEVHARDRALELLAADYLGS